MVFASFVFLFWFLPAFLAVYQALPKRWRNLGLVLGSFVFYGWWRPAYVLLMLVSVVIDYVAARRMGEVGSGTRRKAWLWASIVANLGMLGWFKYTNLLVATWNDTTPWPIAWTDVLLPVGISFFTFQSMSYTIDVYRGDVKPARSFVDFLCFVSLFPQLVAGPIVRYRDVEGELQRRTVTLQQVSSGVFLFAIGFAKKVLIADSVAPLVDHVYASGAPGLLAAWAAAFGYATQIYFDFSGYSDMAIGLGLVLGFHFPANFRSPYRAHSITELWRRWHISLSTWLRDYLYVPLGGNRRGDGIAMRNVIVTMLLGGLWHGASWTFLLWGAWHGAFLAFERRLGKRSPYGRLPLAAQVAITFLIWTLGMVVFRAGSMSGLGVMLRGLAGLNGAGALPALGQQAPFALVACCLGPLLCFTMPRSEQLVQRCHPLVMLLVLGAFVAAVCQLLTHDFLAFIYFQF
ncbi:MAG: membrane-bound O-acyltransferase family protein [Planctomycetes bacterium]|nr:membrane-bound O-acyltransferase family protein [Planctomycetota bacterium]MCC7397291.1 MBOAT family protein [Planctomycetota bacterium]